MLISNIPILQDDSPKVTFSNCVTGGQPDLSVRFQLEKPLPSGRGSETLTRVTTGKERWLRGRLYGH